MKKGRNNSTFTIEGQEPVHTVLKDCITGVHDPHASVEQRLKNYFTIDKHDVLVVRSDKGMLTCKIITNDPLVYFIRKNN